MANVIKQIVNGSGDSQSIKMIVKDNERGPQGEKGETGAAATISAGQAYSTAPGSDPAVINTGTSSAAVFDFYIPKGEKGAPGLDGKDGKNGKDGQDGAIQYKAGAGIQITSENVINATGAAVATWGAIQGTISNQTDLQSALNAKQNKLTAGSNITISNDTISATDTTYPDFTGTDGTGTGVAGLVPAPATTDTDKYLSSSGDWETISVPTVNDATLTIQQNGTDVATFTANSSTNATANITSPIITMTTADPGEGAALATNNYIAVYGANPVIMDYSTSEINTGFTWIDGSAIYKKTVNIGTLPNNTTKTVAHNIANFSALIKLEGNFTNGTNSAPIPYSAPTASKNVQAYMDSTNVTIGTGEDRSAYSGYVTVYYTKSS